MLDVQEECLAEAPLLTVSGRFDGLGAEAFDRAAARLCPRPDLPLLLDLAGVDYVSSAGLRSVLRLAKTCWQQNTRLWLLALQPAVLHVFEMAGLLQQFDALANRADAVRRLHELGAAGARSTTVTLAGRQHTLQPRPAAESTLERWPATPAQPLTCLALDELGLAFGRAGLGNHAAAASAATGPFVATENMVCVRSPETATAPPDFIISAHPADVPVYVAEAWRLSGTPAAFVAADEGTSSVADVLAAFPELLRLASGRLPAACAWIIAALEADGATDAGWVGVGCQPADGPWQMEAVHVRPLALSARPGELGTFLQTALRTETLVGAEAPEPTRRIGRYIAWLYAPTRPGALASRSLQLAFAEVSEPPEEWEWIARRIYAGAGAVELRHLHGGYSAATFHVESRDRDGRRLLPTVLKIAPRAAAEREDRAYDLYVSPYILNNSAVRIGRCARNEWVGLRYNFVGITGPDSRLNWLGEHVVKQPISASLPLFRCLFEKILLPWYGQARPGILTPYREHDPRRLFTGLADTARDVLDIDPEQPFLSCPPLERLLPNPYFLLEHVYPKRAAAEWPGLSSIVHGDLNLNNVLLDEKENLYVIDFSETGMGDLGGDFARLEPLLLIQMTRLGDEADLSALLRYLHAAVRPERLFDPPAADSGDDPFALKAQALVRLLRAEVQQLAGGRQHAVPYLLALLRWTLPIVAFRQMPLLRKQAAAYAAALMTEALLEADPAAAAFFQPCTQAHDGARASQV
jgi:anti-anti-sigma factor